MRNWTVDNLESGMYIVRDDKNKTIKDTNYLATVMYKVGYNNANSYPKTDNIINKVYSMVSMADGWIRDSNFEDDEPLLWRGKNALVDYLNDPKHSEYRMATQEEVVRVVLSQRSKYNL